MENIKKHFEDEAKDFDEIIVKLIPHYNQMVDAMIDAIPFDKEASISILDLGCGTGTISQRISNRFPKSRIVCLDIASNMIEISRYKLSDHMHSEHLVGDFNKIKDRGKFDVVVSSLALHHLETDTDKKEFYATIFDHLNDKGVFYNADVTLASTNFMQQRNIDKWMEFMSKSVSMEEITSKWIPTYEKEDRPAKLINQLKWLEDIGFKTVDVIWKYYNFAVYGGTK